MSVDMKTSKSFRSSLLGRRQGRKKSKGSDEMLDLTCKGDDLEQFSWPPPGWAAAFMGPTPPSTPPALSHCRTDSDSSTTSSYFSISLNPTPAVSPPAEDRKSLRISQVKLPSISSLEEATGVAVSPTVSVSTGHSRTVSQTSSRTNFSLPTRTVERIEENRQAQIAAALSALQRVRSPDSDASPIISTPASPIASPYVETEGSPFDLDDFSSPQLPYRRRSSSCADFGAMQGECIHFRKESNFSFSEELESLEHVMEQITFGQPTSATEPLSRYSFPPSGSLASTIIDEESERPPTSTELSREQLRNIHKKNVSSRRLRGQSHTSHIRRPSELQRMANGSSREYTYI